MAYCQWQCVSRIRRFTLYWGLQTLTLYPAGAHSVFRVTWRKDSIRKPHSPNNRPTLIHQDWNRILGRVSKSPSGKDELDAREGSSNCSARGIPGRLLVGDDGADPNNGIKRLHIKKTSPVRKQTRTDVLIGRSGKAHKSVRVDQATSR
jgi:hypothetical protein